MHEEIINDETRRVLATLAGTRELKSFYLAGGTALALRIGHRLSVDLDWFSLENFSNASVKESVSQLGSFSISGEEEGTIHGALESIKVSFLRYPYPLLFPTESFDGASIADVRDIAAMKLDAVSSRGSRKDFYDLFVLLERYSLEELFSFFEKRYATLHYNRLHILKSLVYFDDADEEPDPVLLGDFKRFSWETVKARFRTESERMCL